MSQRPDKYKITFWNLYSSIRCKAVTIANIFTVYTDRSFAALLLTDSLNFRITVYDVYLEDLPSRLALMVFFKGTVAL